MVYASSTLARSANAWHGMTRQRRGMPRRGMAWQGLFTAMRRMVDAGSIPALCADGVVGHRMARRGEAGHGEAGLGLARGVYANATDGRTCVRFARVALMARLGGSWQGVVG